MKTVEFLMKLTFDVAAWAWGCQLLAWGLGQPWGKVACITAGIVTIWVSMRRWPQRTPAQP